VRVYYSPEVIEWLEHDRQGTLPDGAIIIKVFPLRRCVTRATPPLPMQWTVMTRDSAAWSTAGSDYFSSNPHNANPPPPRSPTRRVSSPS
jgi:hypothetical protein